MIWAPKWTLHNGITTWRLRSIRQGPRVTYATETFILINISNVNGVHYNLHLAGQFTVVFMTVSHSPQMLLRFKFAFEHLRYWKNRIVNKCFTVDIVAARANDRHSGRGVRSRRGLYSTEIIQLSVQRLKVSKINRVSGALVVLQGSWMRGSVRDGRVQVKAESGGRTRSPLGSGARGVVASFSGFILLWPSRDYMAQHPGPLAISRVRCSSGLRVWQLVTSAALDPSTLPSWTHVDTSVHARERVSWREACSAYITVAVMRLHSRQTWSHAACPGCFSAPPLSHTHSRREPGEGRRRGLHGLKTEARTQPVPEIVWPDPTRAAQLNLEPEPDPKSPPPPRIAN